LFGFGYDWLGYGYFGYKFNGHQMPAGKPISVPVQGVIKLKTGLPRRAQDGPLGGDEIILFAVALNKNLAQTLPYIQDYDQNPPGGWFAN
jgi:hypothetical protein